jgi:hypothetical protein
VPGPNLGGLNPCFLVTLLVTRNKNHLILLWNLVEAPGIEPGSENALLAHLRT